MKKSFLAVALAAAFTTLTFAQAAPPSNPQTAPSQDQTTKKTKKNHAKKSKKQEKKDITGSTSK
jgi:hypothetical protein